MSLEVSIRKKLGSFYLDMDFRADEGVFALLGASGSGKSMTLKCIAGIETPDSGRIVLNGRTLFDSEKKINLPPQKRSVGYLFQNYALFPNMTVQENVEAGIRGPRGERRRAAEEHIRRMYLEGQEDKYPSELSGGQQQRVALARIFASSPEIILLDEPLAALDSYLKWRLEMELSDTLGAYGGLSLMVSHDRDEVFRMCDGVCVINDGKSEPVITVSRLFKSPGTLSSALLSGCKNFSAARGTGERSVFAEDWGVQLETAEEAGEDVRYIGVRAHYVRLAKGEGPNCVRCRVLRVTEELFGMTVMLEPLEARGGGDFSSIRMELSKEEWAAAGAGSLLYVRLAPEDIMLLK